MPHTYTHLAENTCLHIQIRTTLQMTNEYRITFKTFVSKSFWGHFHDTPAIDWRGTSRADAAQLSAHCYMAVTAD